MKKKMTMIFTVFASFLIIILCYVKMISNGTESRDKAAEQVIALNELEQLAKAECSDAQYLLIEQNTKALRESLYEDTADVSDRSNQIVEWMAILCFFYLLVVFAYVYLNILRPFDKMKNYAGKLAQGNFDIPLNYERSNYFGEFTWAFDRMRREITKARVCEREAIDNNKTVIATLSHDIKAPISSIRAYAEGLEANLNGSAENRSRYLNVIMKKCDEVSRLTNDLFLHSLSDLDKLKMMPEPVELCSFLKEILTEITAELDEIIVECPKEELGVWVDKNRFVQMMENLILNAKKYTGGSVRISVEAAAEEVLIRVRDYGKGIPDKDMPFIFNKFYRGSNCGKEPGSGLGLYIVKYITEQMNGQIQLHNHRDGLEVLLCFPRMNLLRTS